jgi:hypothetical protein
MNRKISTLIMALFISATSFAQLSGTYYIPSGGSPSYATIQAAMADLNATGINGITTFLIAADYTEQAPAGGLVLGSAILNPSSVTYSITFQKTGSGANPLITAFTGTTTNLDGIWKIAGTDNVTINGIDLAESAGNGDQTTRMEFGYALVKLSSTAPFDGCQNVTVKNCTITLNKDGSPLTTCTGIYSANHTATSNVNINITDGTLADAMNNCKFFNNNITNVTNGIWLAGYNGPLALYDQNNEIGVSDTNTITNFNTYGIRVAQNRSLVIANNLLTSITLPATSIYGIYTQNILGSDTYNNLVTIQPTGGNFSINGISVIVSSAPEFSGSIYNNTVQNCTNAAATSASFSGIVNSGGPGNLNFYNNTVKDNNIQGTGQFTGMNSGGSTVNLNMYNNAVYNNTKTGTSGAMTCLQSACTGTGITYGNNIYSNTNIITTATATQGGTLTGVNVTGGNPAKVYKNQVYNLTANGGTGIVNGISSNATQAYIYNNFVSDLKTPAATTTTTAKTNSVAGINISGGTTVGAYFNTIYLNASSTGVNFYTAALFASTSPTVDLRNNILVNLTTPAGAGISAAYRRSNSTLPSYSNNSNANAFWAGATEDATHAIFYNGTTAYDFATYQAHVGPVRDASSFRELPTFANVAAPPYNLHIDATVSTLCESGGLQISSPVNITDDFDGNTRAAVPDIGADEFAGIFNGVLNPSGVNATLISSSQINMLFTPNPSNNNVVIVWNNTGLFTTPAGAPPANSGDPFAGGFLLSNGTSSPVSHSGLTGATTYYYKAFSYYESSSSYSTGVVVSNITNIAPPTGFTATAISSSQINLAWTRNAFNNDVIIATNSTNTFGQPVNGTAYVAGNPLPTAGTVIYVGPLSAFSHSPLSSYTIYYYKIWSVDPSNNNVYSPTGVEASATTLCSPSAIPFNEGFEYGGQLGCGILFDANNDGNVWQAYYTSTNAHGGTYLLRIFNNVNNDWYLTNGLQLTAGVTYEVKFWYRTNSAIGAPHQLEVKWGTVPTVAGMTGGPIYYNSSVTASTTYSQVTCSSFTPATTGIHYIGFHDFSAIAPGHQLYLDDLSVTVTNVPASITWTGTSNSDWFISGNWNPVGVPGSATAVTIPGGLTNYPAISVPTICSSIAIASGASLLDNGNLTVTGTTTVDRGYTGGEWHLVSSPVSGATANMFLGSYLQKHTESANIYTDIANPATPLNVMQGYALWNDLAGTAQFTGPLNTGVIGSANNVTRISQGWNLVGNPYASSIDWDAATGWTKTNLDNATYCHVNNATWATYVGGVGANGGTRYIAPCQGFFVGVTDGQTIGTLSMDNNVRTNNIATFFKNEVSDIVRLEVSGNGYTDETVIRFLDAATAGFDGNWDAHKLFGSTAEAPAIYSSSNGMMSINSLPPAVSVPIGVTAGVDGEFTITATETSEFADVILEDIIAGTFTNLRQKSYTFNYELNTDNRFILHFSPMGIPESAADLVDIYSIHHDVYVSVPESTSGEIEIFNLLGQKVAHTQITGTLNRITLENGNYYLVRVLSNDLVVTKKVFVK